MEFGTTSRLAAGTAAAVQFGVDPQDALDKISKLQERLSTLETVRCVCPGFRHCSGSSASSRRLPCPDDTSTSPDTLLPCHWCALSSAVCAQAVLEQREEFGKRVVRKVPVEWIGVASEVQIMGDFDGWTRGHDLSAEDVASDSVYSRCAWAGVCVLGRVCLSTGQASPHQRWAVCCERHLVRQP